MQLLAGRFLQQLFELSASVDQVIDLCGLEAQVDLVHSGLAQCFELRLALAGIEQRFAVPDIAGLGPLVRAWRLMCQRQCEHRRR
ncbi:hypothetical protein D3C85_1786210 [compost metagenome]